MKKRLFNKKNGATAITGYEDHLIVNGLFAVLVVIVLLIRQNGHCLEVFLGMTYSTLLCSPDIDSSRARVYRNWWIFRIVWRPYTLMFKHQGNDWNFVFNTKRGIGHNLFLGTLFRIMYGSLLFLIVGCIFPKMMVWITDHYMAILYIILGIWLADGCHVLVDGLVHRN